MISQSSVLWDGISNGHQPFVSLKEGFVPFFSMRLFRIGDKGFQGNDPILSESLQRNSMKTQGYHKTERQVC